MGSTYPPRPTPARETGCLSPAVPLETVRPLVAALLLGHMLFPAREDALRWADRLLAAALRGEDFVELLPPSSVDEARRIFPQQQDRKVPTREQAPI